MVDINYFPQFVSNYTNTKPIKKYVCFSDDDTQVILMMNFRVAWFMYTITFYCTVKSTLLIAEMSSFYFSSL
jgi:hypothetical protein